MNFSMVDTSMYESQPDIEHSLDFCMSQLVKNSDEYFLTKINDIEESFFQDKPLYSFDLDINSNDNSLPPIQLSCLVQSNPKTNKKEIVSYSLTSESNLTGMDILNGASGEYEMLDVQTLVNTFEYQLILQDSVKQFTAEISDMGLMNRTNFTIDQILGVFIQPFMGGLNFQFQVGLTDFAGICFKVQLNVQYNEMSNKTQITSYFGGGWAGDFDSNTNVFVLKSSPSNSEDFFHISNCFSVDLNNLDQDGNLKPFLTEGIFKAAAKIATAENIPLGALKILMIENVYQEVMNPRNLKVSIAFVNDVNNTLIDANFLINSDEIISLTYITILKDS